MKKAASTVALLFLVAGAAHAQVDYVGSWIGANDLRRQVERSQDNRGVGKHPKREEADSASTPVVANAEAAYLDAMRDLRYEPSALVTRRVNAGMAGVLAGQRPVGQSSSTIQLLEACFSQHPEFRRLLAAQVGGTPDVVLGALNAGVLQRRFRQRLEDHGYSADNIADVSNAFLIDAWTVVNGEVDQAMAYRGLQAELRRMLSDGREPPRLSAETRQENTEALALLAMLVGAARHNARTPEDLASLRSGVSDIGRRMGVELRQVSLTEHGFVAR